MVGAAGLPDQRTLRCAAGSPAVGGGGADPVEPGSVWSRGRSALAPPSSQRKDAADPQCSDPGTSRKKQEISLALGTIDEHRQEVKSMDKMN